MIGSDLLLCWLQPLRKQSDEFVESVVLTCRVLDPRNNINPVGINNESEAGSMHRTVINPLETVTERDP